MLSHATAIQLAVSSSVPPATSEVFIAMDVATGVTISKSLSVTGDVTMTGNMNNTSNFTTNGILIAIVILVIKSALVSGHQI